MAKNNYSIEASVFSFETKEEAMEWREIIEESFDNWFGALGHSYSIKIINEDVKGN